MAIHICAGPLDLADMAGGRRDDDAFGADGGTRIRGHGSMLFRSRFPLSSLDTPRCRPGVLIYE